MKTCISCGEDRNPEDARFCAGCGVPLVDASSTLPDAAEPKMEHTSAASGPEPVVDPGPEPAWDPALLPVEPDAVARYDAAAWAEAPAPVQTSALEPSRESRYWAIAAHATALFGGFLGGIPAFLGPLVVWLIRKDDDTWSAGHGRDALNFNLSVLCYGFVLGLLAIVTLGIGLLIAIPGWIFLALGWFALTIVGTIKAADDKRFKYPLTIRFVK